MATKQLICKNEKVIAFYKEHPNISFTTMNVVFTNIMISLMEHMNSSLTANIATQLIDKVGDLHKDLTTMSTNIEKMQQDLLVNISFRLTELKKEYIDTIKMVLTNNTTEHIVPNIKECTKTLHEKTVALINDSTPKNSKFLVNEIKISMNKFAEDIHADTKKIVNNSNNGLNNKSLSEFMTNVDTKITNILHNFQQTVSSNIVASEQRLDTRITDVKNLTTADQAANAITQQQMTELLKKMEISSVKGKCSENILFNILHTLYPSAQINFVGDQKETGDIILTRKNKPVILIENKAWNKNVVQDEVKKFIRDVETQKCCGLFLSQNYGIANKENYEIGIHNRQVLLYVHEVNNNAEKIKIAIDIIDNFKNKLDEITDESSDSYSIDKEVLDDINKEYQYFASQQMTQIKMLKDFTQKMIKQIDDAQLPSLKNFLSTRYAFSSSEFVCDICGYVAKNQSALGAHKRGKECKKKAAQINEESVV